MKTGAITTMKASNHNALLAMALLLASQAALPAAALYRDGGTADIPGDGDGTGNGTDGTWNSTLLNWDAGASPHVAWSNTTGLPDPVPDGYEYHTFKTAGPVSGTPKDFIRVRVND